MKYARDAKPSLNSDQTAQLLFPDRLLVEEQSQTYRLNVPLLAIYLR